MPEFAVLYDAQAGNWLRFSHPLEELEVRSPDQVIRTLQSIEQRVEDEGLFAAGFISYEAAPAFDEAFQTRAGGEFPLLRFGLFSHVERIDLPAPAGDAARPAWQAEETAAGFADKVEAIRAAIARGETYQVNLTFPLSSDFDQDPWPFFLTLVKGQQAGHAGYLETERWAVCSVSPELFFAREANLLRMRPMKGTAQRGRTLAEDRQRGAALLNSAKNRAENIMILDMVRNDLGRLAPPGGVQTEAIYALEKYPTVWQLTSTATARSNASLAEVFRVLFPCASITGAPKVRTMQIIAAAEEKPRRIYTGAFGWLAPGRQAHFSVAIRTVLVDKQRKTASYGVGAGITWDSDGGEEYRECLDKARVLAEPCGDFALIETLRWTHGKGFFILPQHLARLQASAEYFGFACDPEEVCHYLEGMAEDFPAAPQRVRLLLHHDGRLEGTSSPLVADSNLPLKICLASAPVDSGDILLYHKTTHRQRYESRLAEAPGFDEVVLCNERGEVTECCTANLVVEKAGQLVTPPLASGLLPGTYREYLLQRGVIREQPLTAEDLQACRRIFLINAVRKWRPAVFCGQKQHAEGATAGHTGRKNR